MNQPLARADAVRQLLQDIAADMAAYRALLELLDEQFVATVGHKLARLGALAEQIGQLVAGLEQRRAQRVALASQLTGPAPSMDGVFALLRPDARERALADWQALEQMVAQAKDLSRRNGALMADQYTIMQRVLHGEDTTYEPA